MVHWDHVSWSAEDHHTRPVDIKIVSFAKTEWLSGVLIDGAALLGLYEDFPDRMNRLSVFRDRILNKDVFDSLLGLW